jgi:lambda family phage portal protein
MIDATTTLPAKTAKLPRPPRRKIPLRERRAVRAAFDAAEFDYQTAEIYRWADGLSADAAASSAKRRSLRNRSRYEIKNNPYARGIVNSVADYTIGTGPTLQILTRDKELGRAIEADFAAWAAAISLAEKLWLLVLSRVQDGEGFGKLIINPEVAHPSILDLQLFEGEQCTTPATELGQAPNSVDGIEFDAWGNPTIYHVLREHPGGGLASGADPIPARNVIHLFRRDRPGLHRGIPETTASLPIFSLSRRFTLAVISAAENAANVSGVIETDGVADDAADDSIEAMDDVPVERGTFLALPYKWKMHQMRAEQPSIMYREFIRALMVEAARGMGVPSNIALGDSSDHSYASGRLDHQAWFQRVEIDPSRIGSVVLDRLLSSWWAEMVLAGALPPAAGSTPLPHRWMWRSRKHVDPKKEAEAQAVRLAAGTTTLSREYGAEGLDWETESEQIVIEREFFADRGIIMPGGTTPPSAGSSPAPGGGESSGASSQATNASAGGLVVAGLAERLAELEGRVEDIEEGSS